MTPFKLFSAGLIAVAMLTTSAVAHETSAAERYVAQKHHESAASADHWLYSHARVPAPTSRPRTSPAAFATTAMTNRSVEPRQNSPSGVLGFPAFAVCSTSAGKPFIRSAVTRAALLSRPPQREATREFTL